MALSVDEELLNQSLEEEATPDDVRNFFDTLGVSAKSYSVLIRKPSNTAAGGYLHVDTLKSTVPSIDMIGTHYGPGEYKISFSWYQGKNAPGGAKSMIKDMELSLPVEPWRRRHLRYLSQLDREAEEENTAAEEQQLRKATVKAVSRGLGAAGGNSLEELRAAASILRELNPQGQPAPKMSIVEIATAVAAIVGAIAPIVSPLLGRKDEFGLKDVLAMQQKSTDQLIALMGQQNKQGDDMGVTTRAAGLFNAAIGMAEKAIQLGGAPEKETIAEKIFGLLETVGPQMLEAFANKSLPERQADPMYNLAANSHQVKQLQTDPELLERVVTRMDREWGFEQTNAILAGLEELDIKRPASTLANATLYPTTDAPEQS